MTNPALKGALIGGIGGPVLLSGLLTLLQSKPATPDVLPRGIFLLVLVGPFAALAGAVIGRMVHRWRERDVTPGRVSVRAASLGACLGALTLWASVGFLYSFGAWADRLGIIGWLMAFWPIVAALLPEALLIGAACGWLIALGSGPAVPRLRSGS